MRGFPAVFLAMVAAALACPSWALADPCKAIPDKGPAPFWLRQGAKFAGPVPYVGDGDSLCIDVGMAMGKGYSADGRFWVEVRLADFYAPELHEPGGANAKVALEQIVRGRFITCVADHQSYDRMVARCEVGGRSLGDMMRSTGVAEGGRGRQ